MSQSYSSSVSSSQDHSNAVGQLLRHAREEQGLSIEDIANQLCIRAVHLRAIEDGDYDTLPALVYARGFVRSYADFLSLDQDDILNQFRRETAGREEVLDPVYIPSNSNRQLPSKRVIIGSIAAFLVVIMIWSYWSSPSSVESSTNAEAVGSIDMPDEEGTELTTPKELQQNVYAPSEGKKPAAAAIASSLPAVPPAPTTIAETAPNATAVAEEPATPPPSGIALEAVSDAWVEIADANGRTLFNKVLRKGETYPVPANFKGAFLTTGNAGGLMLRINGQRAGLLGNTGEVVHDILLDARQMASRARDLPR